ncbi:uncharacterized protein LOC141714249 [Apium graveolens]|uniref:uncharacterized protein LOC141714249 n=1 Tax=Apium graveolens TaxID=4045 RepID=UPI003D7BE65C
MCEVYQKGSDDVMDCEAGAVFGDNLGDMFLGMQNGEDPPITAPSTDPYKFKHHMEEGKQPLYPGCLKFLRLSFIVRMYSLKCIHGITEAVFGDLLQLMREAFPDAYIPLYFSSAKSIIKDLGLDYQNIHACPNDCMIYWGENKDDKACKTCDISIWKVVEKKGITGNDPEKVIRKVLAKVMRYFPLKPRMQRLFMSKEYSKLMTWHDVGRKDDWKLRHPADAKAWKEMDSRYPDFLIENRNIRLGVISDGFSPYRTIKSPKNSIDVYMQPLIEELKELWDVGINTYDAETDQNFRLRASVLWTISDFPGYAMLSSWSIKGKLACPIYHYETSSMYLKHSRKMCYMNHRKFLHPEYKWRFDKKRFNGKVELGQPPSVLTGTEVVELLSGFENQFGKDRRKKGQKGVKYKKINSPSKKKSIFFDLPYWSHNLLRHKLDIMHIEINICDNILGTLLNIPGKSKDHLNARLDLQEMGIRKDLYPFKSSDGKHLQIRAAIFDMTNQEKYIFCSVLKKAKLPYGYAANISRYVHTKERIISGYKSHDAHFVLHYLLQFAVKKTLKDEVASPLIRLGAFLRALWSKVIDLDDLRKLQEEIIEIVCSFGTIFPQAFFDVMIHLLLHLCNKVEYVGPAHLGCMWEIERYLARLKSYVLNREHRVLVEGAAISQRYKRERAHTGDFWNWMEEEVGKKEDISKELKLLAVGPNRAAKQFSGYVINGGSGIADQSGDVCWSREDVLPTNVTLEPEVVEETFQFISRAFPLLN